MSAAPPSTDAIDSESLHLFKTEGEETVEAAQSGLLRLEIHPGDSDLIDALFRYFHTLKGNAASVFCGDLERIAHRAEDLLSLARDGTYRFGAPEITWMLQGVDLARDILARFPEPFDKPGTIAGFVARGESFIARHETSRGISSRAKPATKHDDPLAEVAGADGVPFTLSQPDRKGLEQYRKMGLSPHVLICRFEASCAMRSAGAFLISRELSRFGQIFQTSPKIDQIDDLDCPSVAYLLLSASDPADLAEVSKVVGVVESVTVSALDLDLPEGSGGTDEHGSAGAGSSPPDAPSSRAAARGETGGRKSAPRQTIRIDLERLNDIMDLVGELVIARSQIDSLTDALRFRMPKDLAVKELHEKNEHFAKDLAILRDSVIKSRMLPIGTLFQRFTRVIRDLATELEKTVNLVVLGEETELDKTVIDLAGEPLLHMIRNAVDHGLETSAERVKNGKPAAGTLTIAARHAGDRIVIEVSDDGRGLDPHKLRSKAARVGLLTAETAAALTDHEAQNLIFEPGFSTAETITEVSGRGVGMDAVKRTVERLRGTLRVDSQLGRGTRFLIEIPLTLAILPSLLVRVATETVAVPLGAVHEIVRIEPHQIRRLPVGNLLHHRDRVFPLVDPGAYLGPRYRRPADSEGVAPPPRFAILAGSDERLFAFPVDALEGKQDLVIKSIESTVLCENGIGGASILGNGRVVLVLDMAMFQSAPRSVEPALDLAASEPEEFVSNEEGP